MKKAQKQTSQEYGLSASFLDLKFVQKAPQNAITLLACYKRQLTVILCADTPCSHKRVVAWHKEPSRCHSDMCIPVIYVFPPIWLPVKCVSPTPTLQKIVGFISVVFMNFANHRQGDFKWFKIMSNIIDKRETIRDKTNVKLFLADLASSDFFLGRNVDVNIRSRSSPYPSMTEKISFSKG